MKGVWFASIGVAVIAAIVLARLTVFLVDVEQPQLSVESDDRWRTAHSCLTAYAEAARFAAEPDRNIYDPALYEGRRIRGLKVDTFHYAPPFLLLPGAMQRVAGDYITLRPLWFAMQLAVLGALLVVIARCARRAGAPEVMLAAPLFVIAPTTLYSLQMGNFQSSAVALALLGMLGLVSSRAPLQAVGGIALAYAALAKVFPGILVVYLVVTRRWRAVAWTAGAAVALVMLTAAVYGTGSLADFVDYQLPRLSSGEAFPQAEKPQFVGTNMSFYGLLVKLRALGATGLDVHTGLAINSIYGVVVLALAVAVAWRRRHHDGEASARLGDILVWLALVNLASFRSPFIGNAYGIVGSALVAVIGLGAATTARARAGWALAYVAMFAAALLVPTPGAVPTTTRVVLALLVQVAMLALNTWVCVGGLRRASRPILDP